MSYSPVGANMTDAELIDEGLDCDVSSLAYRLAKILNAMPINQGHVQTLEDDCRGCDTLRSEITDLESEVSTLESKLEGLDVDQLIAGAKRAKEAVKLANDKLIYLFKLGGDDDK